MKPFARIPAAIPRSGIREIMDLAWAVEKTGEVIHLEVGQPDFATPESIVEATCRYARAGHTKYVPNAGVDALRAAAARYFERRTGVPTTSENILVTPGAVMSVATSFLAPARTRRRGPVARPRLAQLRDGRLHRPRPTRLLQPAGGKPLHARP